MGDIADAMLEGDLCEGCGEYMEGGSGFPQYCSAQCAKGRGVFQCDTPKPRRQRRRPSKEKRMLARDRELSAGMRVHPCSKCEEKFKTVGAARQHEIDKHKDSQP